MRGASILHADLDAFYASVEQLLDPSLRGRPIAVGGSASGGVVLAASYEARRFGVSGAMSGRQAKLFCPQIQFVSGHFSDYQRIADQVVDIFRDFTPLVERISIDEAFLDVRGAINLFGQPGEIARQIRNRVLSEVGLAISIGVASTKHLAKVASQVAKPDGLVIVQPGTEQEFLDPLPVGLLWGVGKVTQARLAARGISTIGQLAAADKAILSHFLGQSAAATLTDRAKNVDARRIETHRRARSVGAQSACGRQLPSREFLVSTFGYLADRVTRRLRSKSLCSYTITVRVRFGDLRSVTRSVTLDEPTDELLTVRDTCVALARDALGDHPTERYVSLLGLSTSQLISADEPRQLHFCFEVPTARDRVVDGERKHATDAAIDRIRERFGNAAIGLWSTSLGARGVDEGFRALAEH